jgi:hypothetical protein
MRRLARGTAASRASHSVVFPLPEGPEKTKIRPGPSGNVGSAGMGSGKLAGKLTISVYGFSSRKAIGESGDREFFGPAIHREGAKGAKVF